MSNEPLVGNLFLKCIESLPTPGDTLIIILTTTLFTKEMLFLRHLCSQETLAYEQKIVQAQLRNYGYPLKFINNSSFNERSRRPPT